MNRVFPARTRSIRRTRDAAIWYNSQRPGLGVEFLEAVEAALEQIARWPQIGRIIPGVPDDVPARRFPVARFPYYIAYLEWNQVIRLLAFAHDRRKPGYWFSRM